MAESVRILNEAFYHFVWQHKLFNKEQLKTVCGLPVEVIHSGLLNSDAGPDFFNVKVKIDGVLWAGNVEIHTQSKDWTRHHHQEDSAYDNVILHVVKEYQEPVYNSKGREIPSLIIAPLGYVYDNFQQLVKDKQTIACAKHLPQIDPLFLMNYRDRLATERLERKSQHIKDVLVQNNGDWEDAFLQILSRSFGFGINSDTFERLGKSLSYKVIAKHRDNRLQLEALLYGQAGFLAEAPKDDYQAMLQKEYTFLNAKYNLQSIDHHLWKFLRLRPSNFPTIRIALLSDLLHQHPSLLQLIIKTETTKLEELFRAKVSSYWESHYTFGKLSNKRSKSLGKTAIHTLLINSVAPLLFSYGKHSGKEELCDKALQILNTLPAEKNSIITRWDSHNIICQNAFDSQAQIQLYNEYCLKRKCMHCNIGHHYVSLQH